MRLPLRSYYRLAMQTTLGTSPRPEQPPRPQAPRSVALRFERVSFAYGDTMVLDSVSFHVHEGEFTALVGPNGAGKTTVLRLLLGLARPQAGSVTVFGNAPNESRAVIGYVPQHASYDPAFPISVAEVVRMGRLRGTAPRRRADDARDREAVDRALALAGLSDLGARPYSALSGGQRRRVLVARALAAEPRFLVLDEPTANMDAESEARLYETLKRLKGQATILIVTHDTAYVSSLTDAVFCVGGRERSVVKHKARPAPHAAGELFGGSALEVLHDTELPDDACCKDRDGK